MYGESVAYDRLRAMVPQQQESLKALAFEQPFLVDLLGTLLPGIDPPVCSPHCLVHHYLGVTTWAHAPPRAPHSREGRTEKRSIP